MRLAVILLITLEALALLLVALAVLRFLRGRHRAGPSTGDVLEDALAAAMPRRVAGLISLEIHGWSALMTVLRRWRGQSAGNQFPYSGGLRTLMGVLLAWVVIEVPILVFISQLLIPWAWVRVILLLVGLYAVWWVASTWASFVTLPHALSGGSLGLHVGTLARMVVPLVSIADVSRIHRTWKSVLGPSIEGATVGLPIFGQTTIRVRLIRPSVLHRIFGRDVEAAEIHVQVDDPGRMLDALSHLVARDNRQQTEDVPRG